MRENCLQSVSIESVRKWKVENSADDSSGSATQDTPPANLTIAQLRAWDIEKCNAISGGRVSYSGKLCSVWNTSDRNKLHNMATSYGWVPLYRFGGGQNQRSAYTGKDAGNEIADLYIMGWSYQEALAECKGLKGELNVAPGDDFGNVYKKCVIELPPEHMTLTKQQCESREMVWPQGSVTSRQIGHYSEGGYIVNGELVGIYSVSCTFGFDGWYYVGSDLPGQCLPGMEVKSDGTGNCTCKSGLEYISGYRCE